MSRIPDLPGVPVPTNSEQDVWLKNAVGAICNLNPGRFPGSQPVSFEASDIKRLESDDYWVCEKSDGVRVLLFISTVQDDQDIYLINRHNTYYQLQGFFFPHHERPQMPLRNSIIDGELVLDVDPRTKQETLRYLCFDCLVIDNQNVMKRPLEKRYGRLKEWFYQPYQKMLQEFPACSASHPFHIVVKEANLSYSVDKVFQLDIPALHHGNDGLIYTRVSTPYTPGTDRNIMKWKPPSENSIDFKLVLKFPPSATDSPQPDYHAKPLFALHVWNGGDDKGGARAVYEPYDVMEVEDDEWERMKASGEQYDDRIVEVNWDPSAHCWRMMRFRDDKPNGNHRSVVESVIKSIRDGVEREDLLEHSIAIRNAWKTRHARQAAGASMPRHSASLPPAPAPPQHQILPLQQQQQPLPPQPPQPQPPQPPPHMQQQPSAPQPHAFPSSVDAEIRYGPIATSRYSKVSGPDMWAGMYR